MATERCQATTKRDLGADGPAMLARRRAFDPEVGADRAIDSDVLDFYAAIDALTRRQIEAGRELCVAYATGYGWPAVTANLDPPGRDLMSEDAAIEQSAGRSSYDTMMQAAPFPSRRLLQRLVRGQFPDEHMGVAHLAEGLDSVADALRLPR